MDNATNVIDYFKSEIESVSRKEIDSILIEVDGIISEAVSEYQSAAKEDADYAYQRKIEEANSVQAKKMAELSAVKNNSINKKRKEIEVAVFTEAKKQLLTYTSSQEYENKLLDKIGEVCKQMNMDSVTLFLSEKDMAKEAKIRAVVTQQCQLELSPEIQIGGFILENKQAGVIVDESYDSLLEDQRDWFYQNSGLVIQ